MSDIPQLVRVEVYRFSRSHRFGSRFSGPGSHHATETNTQQHRQPVFQVEIDPSLGLQQLNSYKRALVDTRSVAWLLKAA